MMIPPVIIINLELIFSANQSFLGGIQHIVYWLAGVYCKQPVEYIVMQSDRSIA